LAQPDRAEAILARSVACISTNEEDALLHKIGAGVEGWDCY